MVPYGMGGGGAAAPGFFSRGGMLDELSNMGNPMMAESDLPPILKAMAGAKVGYDNGRGGGFNISGPSQDAVMQQAMMARLFPKKKKVTTDNVQPVVTVAKGGERPSSVTYARPQSMDMGAMLGIPMIQPTPFSPVPMAGPMAGRY